MDPLSLILTGGAAGMAFIVLKWLVDGKLHTHSEVEGLQADKAALFVSNSGLTAALTEANGLLKDINALLSESVIEDRKLLEQILAAISRNAAIDGEQSP